ncbi:hypothetical protein [Streptomyces johnsoniae]|uniref:Integral membrane protein n=1 Tax=Streptomyces johnsoniae TaxID=3075532 RepID=A0ABU2SBC1_9ACTN|nr:hypothetical protein [Streptomyces sp. DSM 41886]MDT0446260.1 hypothetical protein [Streptomyces sp. DSM 41886]
MLLGSLLLLGAVAGLAGIPEQVRQERAFLAAEPCQGHAAGHEACLRTLPGTVSATERRSSRSGATYRVSLEGAAGWSSVVRLGAEPLGERLRPGDAVTISLWEGEITALDRDGVTQRLSGTPDFGPQIYAVVVMEATVCGGWFLFIGLIAVRRAGLMAARGVRAALPPLLLLIPVTVLLPLLPALLARNGDGAGPVVATLAAWAALEALALWLLRGRLRLPPA